MADLLSQRLGADRCGGAAVRQLCPRQELLIGPVPLSLPSRVGQTCPRTRQSRIVASRRSQILRRGTLCGRALAGVQGQPPPTQLQAPEAAQAEFVICVQTISMMAPPL